MCRHRDVSALCRLPYRQTLCEYVGGTASPLHNTTCSTCVDSGRCATSTCLSGGDLCFDVLVCALSRPPTLHKSAIPLPLTFLLHLLLPPHASCGFFRCHHTAQRIRMLLCCRMVGCGPQGKHRCVHVCCCSSLRAVLEAGPVGVPPVLSCSFAMSGAAAPATVLRMP